MDVETFFDHVSKVPFLSGKIGSKTGCYEFYVNSEISEKSIEEAKNQIIDDIITETCDEMLLNHTAEAGDFLMVDSWCFFDSYGHYSSYNIETVAGVLVCTFKGDNKKPVIISTSAKEPKQINSSELSIAHIYFHENSYKDGVYFVSGCVLYTY